MTAEARKATKDIVLPIGVVLSMMSAAFYCGQLSVRVGHLEAQTTKLVEIQAKQADALSDLRLSMARQPLKETK